MLSRLTLLIAVCTVMSCNSQKIITKTYTESPEDMLNPERGFYIPSGTTTSNFAPLEAGMLKAMRDTARKVGRSSYAVKISLLYRAYEFDNFKDRPLSEEFLAQLQSDFDIVRTSGLKLILRFAYINKSNKGNCPDAYDICPPYGDAPRHIMLEHIRQLKPVLQRNGDVIAVLQQGFIGIWGENYFTDHFGDASSSGAGRIYDSSWVHRNELLAALLDAMPKNRMVQVRTPQIKQKFVYGPSAPVTARPLTASQAYNGSDAARLGFHNDCFLASADDYGTYLDNGSSTQPKQDANKPLREYIEEDTRFTVVGGETCDDAFSPQNDCEPLGYAQDEMRRMHYTYLNAAYNNQVNNDWDSAGCLTQIRKDLGYRFVLRQVSMPGMSSLRDSVKVKIQIENIGYAALYNPRNLVLVFRSAKGDTLHRVQLRLDARHLAPGVHQVEENIKLPSMPTGEYTVYLGLPDSAPSLAQRPEYAIQFANLNMWDATTGLHDLAIRFRVAK